MTTTNSWLPLTEYSLKYHVSISTLRRRIKNEDIKFRFDDGKYFIFDEAIQRNTAPEIRRPSLSGEQQMGAGLTSATATAPTPATTTVAESGESVITAANKLLTDLKKAYTQVLHEKEEQIMLLREENVDLKTLIKVLESENSRLRDIHQ